MIFKRYNNIWKVTNNPGNNIVKFIDVSATNILFKNEDEQLLIIQNFGRMLNSLDITIQILCISKDVNANDWKTEVDNEDYYNFIKEKTELNRIVIKDFRIVLSHHDESIIDNCLKTIQNCLRSSGLEFNIPESINNHKLIPELITPKYIKYNGIYSKTMYVDDWPGCCSLGWLDNIYNSEVNIDVSMFVHPVDKSYAVQFLKRKLNENISNQDIDIDDDESDYDQFNEKIISAIRMREELYKNGGKFFFMSYYITVKAKSLKNLKNDYEYVQSILKGMDIEINECYLQHDDGRKCTLPYGLDFLGKKYNFTTEPLKHFFPFISSNIIDEGGVLIGTNLLNQGLIFLDPFKYASALMFVLGQIGGGKSYFVKLLCLRLLYMNVQVDIWDCEGEYSGLKELCKLPNLKIHHFKTKDYYKDELKRYITEMEENASRLQPRFLIIDEFWQYLQDDEIMNGINHIARTGRKKHQGMCVITQMVEDLKSHDKVKSILQNASIKALMQMQPNAAREVKEALELTDGEVNFLVTAQHEGILFAGSRHVQFKAMASNKEHKLITTNPVEQLQQRIILTQAIPFKKGIKEVKLNVCFRKSEIEAKAAATRIK